MRDTTVRAMLASGGTCLHCAVVGQAAVGPAEDSWLDLDDVDGYTAAACSDTAAVLRCCKVILLRCSAAKYCCYPAPLLLLSAGCSNAAAHVSTLLLPAAHLVDLSEVLLGGLLHCSEPLLQLLLLGQAGAISIAAVDFISTAAVAGSGLLYW